MTDCYFFDSYAIIEIIRGSPNYRRFANSVIVTTKLNLFEVFYILNRDIGPKIAESILEKYYKFAIDYGIGIIQASAMMRLNNKPHFSMADCVGYKLAEYLGIKFLTGDDHFQGFPNIEFVK